MLFLSSVSNFLDSIVLRRSRASVFSSKTQPCPPEKNKNSRPCNQHCWDRSITSCGATRLDAYAPTQCVPTYADICLRSVVSVSHTPDTGLFPLALRSPFASRLFCCIPTNGSSLKERFERLLTLPQRFTAFYHMPAALSSINFTFLHHAARRA